MVTPRFSITAILYPVTRSAPAGTSKIDFPFLDRIDESWGILNQIRRKSHRFLSILAFNKDEIKRETQRREDVCKRLVFNVLALVKQGFSQRFQLEFQARVDEALVLGRRYWGHE